MGARGAASLPPNEPPLSFDVGSPHREKLLDVVKRVEGETVEIPCVIGGEEVFTGNVKYQLAVSIINKFVMSFTLLRVCL